MIFETHAHYDDKAFNEDREELLKQLVHNDIKNVVNIAADLESCEETIKLVNKYDYFYGAIGVHPCSTGELNDENFNEIVKKNSMHSKVVAIGEIGLDYYWNEPEKNIQKIWFERQLELAKEINKPVVIHSRDAAKDTLDIVKGSKVCDIGGVIHCFSYGVEMAREYLSMGFYLGIGGVITFSNGKKLKEVVEYMPIDRIVLETDSPYLAPVPYRGKRNSSLYLTYVIKEIANIKGISEDEVKQITYANAKKLFKLL